MHTTVGRDPQPIRRSIDASGRLDAHLRAINGLLTQDPDLLKEVNANLVVRAMKLLGRQSAMLSRVLHHNQISPNALEQKVENLCNMIKPLVSLLTD
jgi:hypothetical protein